MLTPFREVRVAGILDDLSAKAFSYECRFLNLDRTTANGQLEEFQPQLLFVESAWHGVGRVWYTQIYNLCTELLSIIQWCKARNIPTVFWNKEDPVHFDTFLGVARLFDYVYTSDMDCIPLYKKMLGHNRVGVLAFASSTALFNPIEKYERKDAFCFAGSYYALQQERCEDFENIFNSVTKLSTLEIYDRNVYPGNPSYTFPEKYQPSIIGSSLPFDKVDIAYKGYKFGITLNTVKRSSTMEARRVFELLACNTLTISNPCTAIDNLLGDLVITYKNEKEFLSRVSTLVSDPLYADKLRLLALRKVLTEHTLTHRLALVFSNTLNIAAKDMLTPHVCVFGFAETHSDINMLTQAFKRQTYAQTQYFIIALNDELCTDIEAAEIVKSEDIRNITDLCNSGYYACFSPGNYYGASYLTDLMANAIYAITPIVGKCSCYVSRDTNFYLENPEKRYVMTDKVRLDRCIIKAHVASHTPAKAFIEGSFIKGFTVTSTDPFNFCEDHTESSCEQVDDISVNTGYSMKTVDTASAALPDSKHFIIQKTISGAEFVNSIVPDIRCMAEFFNGSDTAGIFSIAADSAKMHIPANTHFYSADYSINKFIRIFPDTAGSMDANLTVVFLDSKDTALKSYVLPSKRYLRCGVPDEAVKFFFRVDLGSDAHLLINKIYINAMPSESIPIV